MSVRENIEVYGGLDNKRYIQSLKAEYRAAEHPGKDHAYIVEGLPFHEPREAEDHFSILSFNNLPLPDALLEALVNHPELYPDNLRIRWTQEQDLILEATLGEIRGTERDP